MPFCIGIDIGSTCAKTALLDENKTLIDCFVQPTGWSSVDTAGQIRSRLQQMGYDPEAGAVVATGYGRLSVPYAQEQVTEITCHGKGAAFIYGLADATVIDIGGQDTKIIALKNGAVYDFMMNDKCSAGTGRFLEVMANSLALGPEQLCNLAARGGGVEISSMCTVFAESEVISLMGRGESKENIAFAVVDSIVRKVAGQAQHMLSAGTPVCLTGGLCGSPYIIEALSKRLKQPITVSAQGRYAGAIGAALEAHKRQKKA